MTNDISGKVAASQPKPETISEFYCALGSAIASWQHIETSLFQIFYAAVYPKYSGPLAAAFHSTQHFNSQLSMTDAALENLFAYNVLFSALAPEWAKIKGKLNKKYQRRNALVHYQVIVEPLEPREKNKMYLDPPISDTRHLPADRPIKRYGLIHIAAIQKGFEELAHRMSSFLTAFGEIERQLGAYVQR
jgi:hypothetical protein